MSIGETLARARHQAGFSVAQVSEQTRIRPLIIRGIEADDYSMCGGDFYARGNIRDIAEVVGIDSGPLIAEYDRDHRAAGPVAATSLDELLDRSMPQRQWPQWHRRPAFMLVFGVVAVFAVLAFVGYQLMGSPKPSPAGVTVAANSTDRASQAATGSGGSPDAARSARAAASPSGSAASGSTPSQSPSPGAAPSQSPSPGVAPAPQAQPHSLAAVSAAAFGARSGLGQGDDPQDAHLAIDGLRGTAWHTDWYTTSRFGNLYAGTGLIVDMGRPVTITSVRFTLGPAAGAVVAIRVGDRPVLPDMPPVARSAGPGGVIRLTLARPATGRYLLVWFTRLPPDPAGTYKAEIFGISVKGHP